MTNLRTKMTKDTFEDVFAIPIHSGTTMTAPNTFRDQNDCSPFFCLKIDQTAPLTRLKVPFLLPAIFAALLHLKHAPKRVTASF